MSLQLFQTLLWLACNKKNKSTGACYVDFKVIRLVIPICQWLFLTVTL